MSLPLRSCDWRPASRSSCRTIRGPSWACAASQMSARPRADERLDSICRHVAWLTFKFARQLFGDGDGALGNLRARPRRPNGILDHRNAPALEFDGEPRAGICNLPAVVNVL